MGNMETWKRGNLDMQKSAEFGARGPESVEVAS